MSERAHSRLPARSRKGHKGTFGTVTVVGGCCRGRLRYVGAPALAALGALRSGCGLCRVLAPEPVIQSVLRLVTSATGIALDVAGDGALKGPAAVRAFNEAAESSHAMVIGPGLGSGAGVQRLVTAAWRRGGPPLVLDADGLNALASLRSPGRPRGFTVITPHPGEARRLMKPLGIPGDPAAPSDRRRIAAAIAQRLGCVAVLKGSGTVVSDGERDFVNPSGGPWLATGGTGDVLAGIIGGLLAQHTAAGGDAAERFHIVCAAVIAHGRAGDAWSRSARATGGMLAAELAERIPAEIERLRRRKAR